MANAKQSEEVQVLHFFETAPIEKAEAVFNIVCEKMRERVPNRSVTPRKQRSKTLRLDQPGPQDGILEQT